MDYAEGGDLRTMIEKQRNLNPKFHIYFKEKFIWRIIYDVCRGI